MTDRYYAPNLTDGDSCELDGNELHHLAHVMRVAVGEQVTLFDGQGSSVVAEVAELKKNRATLRVVSRTSDGPELRPRVVLATAVPKADRFRWLVEKATELGVSRLIPLQTARSVTAPGAIKLDKMRATVIEACKQSGRNRLMPIDPLTSWQSFLSGLATTDPIVVADPQGSRTLANLKLPENTPNVTIVIGPEGGLSDAEVVQIVERGGIRVSLGSQILRTETAALALASHFLISSVKSMELKS